MDKNNKIWWQPAMVMFVRVSAWIAGPVLIALFIGRYLDNKYDSAPWMFIGSTAVAFVVSMIAIARISLRYVKKVTKENNKNGK